MKKELNLRGTLHVTDWLQDISYAPAEETETVQVLFKNTRTGFYSNPEKIPLRKGDWVAVEASPGHDIGQVLLNGPLVRLQMKKAGISKDTEIKKIFRKASESDLEKFKEAREREHSTMIRSRQIAAELGLNMKIGDVEYQGDGAKAIFYYIADERVDFRKLIRILADAFKIRIEMKQIGARQEAGRIGGIGPCGRPLCCSSWMSKFVSVGTGAARIQDLSMNPQKLAGQCAKLKCCLNFETDTYAEAARDFPPRDIILYTLDQEYYQFKTDILEHKITYSTDKRQAVNLVTISTQRAKDIIAMNKRGEKPEQLDSGKPEAAPRQEYVELVGQDSLTRFDKKGKKKKKAKGATSGKSEETPASKSGQQPSRPKNRKPDSQPQKQQKQKSTDPKEAATKQQPPRQKQQKQQQQPEQRKPQPELRQKRQSEQQSEQQPEQRQKRQSEQQRLRQPKQQRRRPRPKGNNPENNLQKQ